VATRLEFDDKLSEEEKRAFRKRFGFRAFTQEEKDLLYAYNDISKEFEDKNGIINSDGIKKRDKKFQAFLKEWMKTHKLPE